MRKDRDDYRVMYTHLLLQEAREQGINPEMAVAMAERLHDLVRGDANSAEGYGGMYKFNTRSEA